MPHETDDFFQDIGQILSFVEKAPLQTEKEHERISDVELTRFAGDTAFVSLARCRQRSRPVAYDLPRSRRFPRLVA
jgi:hypothetical protein